MKSYIRDLDDGTEQRAVFEDDPGKSIPQWRLDEPTKKPAKKKAKK